MTQKQPILKPFIALSLLGLIGVLSLIVITVPQLDQIVAAQPELAELPTVLLILMLLLQPTILLLIAIAVGCALAPRVGLVSLIYEKISFGTPILSRLKPQIFTAIVIGLLFAVVIVVLEMVLTPFLGEEFAAAIQAQDNNIFAQLLMGMLYGGITEELLLRWGFMSLLVWLGWLLLGRSASGPSKGVFWTAIIISALLFGIGHLPAMASLVPLTTIIIIRTIALNAIGGIAFGWLFWRYSLEAAMVAHAFAHVGFFIVRLLS